MKKTFIIISVSDRVNELNHLIETINAQGFDDYDINLLYQDYIGNKDKIKYKDRYKNIFVYNEKLGCHGARVQLLKDLDIEKYDIFINLDDDMELIPETNYDNAVKKCLEKGTGFVLTNWARTKELAEKKKARIRNEFIKQVFVYQGGGMVYSKKIARLMKDLQVCHAEFDDIWPLTAYINGYNNYRDMSSLAIHHVCVRGGMRSYMREKIRPLLCKEYVNYRFGKNGIEALIPQDSDLNEKAKLLHRMNKKDEAIL